jgi:hypothetical protein
MMRADKRSQEIACLLTTEPIAALSGSRRTIPYRGFAWKASGTVSQRLHNASTKWVVSGVVGGNRVESMKTSKVVSTSSLTRNARVLASFENATD